MDKLLAKLDAIFEKYQVSEEEIKEVANIINGIDGELNMDGDEFKKPEIEGDSEDGEDEYAEED